MSAILNESSDEQIERLTAERDGYSAAMIQEEHRANALHAECDVFRAKLFATELERDMAKHALECKRLEVTDLQIKLGEAERAATERADLLREFGDALDEFSAILMNSERILITERLAAVAEKSLHVGHDYAPRSEIDEAWRKGMTDAAEIAGTCDFGSSAAMRILAARDAKKPILWLDTDPNPASLQFRAKKAQK